MAAFFAHVEMLDLPPRHPGRNRMRELMAALAFVLCYHFKWWGAIWVLVALLTGLSRIYVGVHYPSQVLLGYLCGVFCAFLVIKTWEAFMRLRQNKANLDVTSG